MTPGVLPAPGAVHLWTMDLAQDPATEAILARDLDGEELARAARFRFAVHRMRFIVRRHACRAILARYVGCDPRDVEFAAGAHGKPTLSRADLAYNSTHSEALAMLAVTGGPAVGLDVERIRDRGDQYEWLSAAERRRVLLLPPQMRTLEALRAWTRKEAYVKALGVGVTGLDSSLEAPPAPDPGAQRWTIVDLDPCPGYVASLAVPFDRPTIVERRWAPATVLSAEASTR